MFIQAGRGGKKSCLAGKRSARQFDRNDVSRERGKFLMNDLYSDASSFFDLKNYLRGKRDVIEKELRRIMLELPQESRVTSAIRHSLMSGGKRIRPILCLASWESASADGSNWKEAAMTGCCLEMIHTYSLIHDDLPAMDNDDLRRGKPTCHKAFDQATAILAGDALLSLAFETLAENAMKTQSDANKRLRIIRLISRASGIFGMVGGQMSDIQAEGRKLSLSALQKMHRQKTGALIAAAVCSGAILGGAGPGELEKFEEYADNIGLAFQVADDILNVEGDPNLMGKAVGTDAERNKNTYPALMGLEESKAFAKDLVSKALDALGVFGAGADPLRSIARYIVERRR
jgi:geranylgeranyl diphosphate synthase type II